MVFPSPGIGRHHIPMHHFAHSHFGSCGGYNYGSGSLFSGLTTSFNNFTNSFMTYSWASLGINAGLSLLSMFLPSSWTSSFVGGSFGTGSSYGSYVAGGGGSSVAQRGLDDITKELKGCAKLKNMGATSADDLKTKATNKKENATFAYNAAKNVEIKDAEGKPYTYESFIKALDVSPQTKNYLNELFKNNLGTKLTAGELETILKRTEDKEYCPDLTEDAIYNAADLDGSNSRTLVENVKTAREQKEAAEVAADSADDIRELNDIDKKINALKTEYAEAKTKIPFSEYNRLKTEYNKIDAKMKKLEGKGKEEGKRYAALSKKLAEVDPDNKIGQFEQAMKDADEIMKEQPATVKPQPTSAKTASTVQQPKNSGQLNIQNNELKSDKYTALSDVIQNSKNEPVPLNPTIKDIGLPQISDKNIKQFYGVSNSSDVSAIKAELKNLNKNVQDGTYYYPVELNIGNNTYKYDSKCGIMDGADTLLDNATNQITEWAKNPEKLTRVLRGETADQTITVLKKDGAYSVYVDAEADGKVNEKVLYIIDKDGTVLVCIDNDETNNTEKDIKNNEHYDMACKIDIDTEELIKQLEIIDSAKNNKEETTES